ncbi:MAG: hypothetical protein ACI9K5_003007 [Gammaproteobacteria bacterium]
MGTPQRKLLPMKPTGMPLDPPALFAACVTLLEEELPWGELGKLYCHEGGEDFFAPAQVDAMREAALKITADLAAALEEMEAPAEGTTAPGASLYVGAAVAELVPALCECLILGRQVRLVNLPGPEVTLINAALGRVEKQLEKEGAWGTTARLPRLAIDTHAVDKLRFDHLWIASVLTDPQAFPALHDELYDLLPRKGKEPVEDEKTPTGKGNLHAERKQARDLLRKFVSRVDAPGVLTTSDEEIELLRIAFEERGLTLKAQRPARLSAIVGDPIRSYRINN